MKQYQVGRRHTNEVEHVDPEVLRRRRVEDARLEGDRYREEGYHLAMALTLPYDSKLLMPLELDL